MRCRELDLTAGVIAVANSAEEEEKRGCVTRSLSVCTEFGRVASHLQGGAETGAPGLWGWGLETLVSLEAFSALS